MADKSFGIKELNLIGASGTPTITSPNNLNLNASNVAISTDVTIGRHLDVDGHAEFDAVNVSGVSTFAGITTVPGPSLFTNQLSVSGVSTFLNAINVNSSYGTSGQVLTSQGSGSAPQWATPTAGYRLLDSDSMSGSQLSYFPTTNDSLIKIAVSRMVCSTTATSHLFIQIGNGSTSGSGYLSVCSNNGSVQSGQTDAFRIIPTTLSSTSNVYSGTILFESTGSAITASWTFSCREDDTAFIVGAGSWTGSSAIDRITLRTNGGNWTSGTVACYAQ